LNASEIERNHSINGFISVHFGRFNPKLFAPAYGQHLFRASCGRWVVSRCSDVVSAARVLRCIRLSGHCLAGHRVVRPNPTQSNPIQSIWIGLDWVTGFGSVDPAFSICLPPRIARKGCMHVLTSIAKQNVSIRPSRAQSRDKASDNCVALSKPKCVKFQH
jgi:hypothetical protein